MVVDNIAIRLSKNITSYWRFIVTMALSRVGSEIINVEKYRDLEVRVSGHSRSLIVVPFERLVWFAIRFYSNFAPITCRVWDIRLVIYTDLETWVTATQGHRNRHGSIRRIWLPINVPWQPWAYLVPFPR